MSGPAYTKRQRERERETERERKKERKKGKEDQALPARHPQHWALLELTPIQNNQSAPRLHVEMLAKTMSLCKGHETQ